MGFYVVDAAQRSDEWKRARAGRLTGSVAGEMFATLKGGGEAAGRRNLRLRLVLERITGRPIDDGVFVSAAMQAGIEREADARSAYEASSGNVVFETGFIAHDTLQAGASLDGHLGDFSELVSIKCRQPAAHLDFVTRGTIPASAMAQMRHEAWLKGATAHHYVSWNPDFPESLQLKYVTLTLAQLDIQAYDDAARAFLKEIDAQEAEVLALAAQGVK